MAGKLCATLLVAVLCVYGAEGLRLQTPSLPSASLPQIPTPVIPQVEIPSPSLPDASDPAKRWGISLPSINIPTPTLPSINIPTPTLPSINIPTPTLPNINLPSINIPTPTLPDINLPSINMPNIPTPDISTLTSIIKNPFGEETKGRCTISGTTAQCCMNFGLSGTQFSVRPCGILRFDIMNLKLVAALTVNDKTLISKDLAKADRVCVPLPPPASALEGCFSIYYLSMSAVQRSIEACIAVSVSSIIRVQFDCILFKDGKLSITTGRDPEDSTLINLNVNQGKPQVSFTKPSWLG